MDNITSQRTQNQQDTGNGKTTTQPSKNMAVLVHVVIRKILLEEIVSYPSKRTTTLITRKLLMH